MIRVGHNGAGWTFWTMIVPEDVAPGGLEVTITANRDGLDLAGDLVAWHDVDAARYAAAAPTPGDQWDEEARRLCAVMLGRESWPYGQADQQTIAGAGALRLAFMAGAQAQAAQPRTSRIDTIKAEAERRRTHRLPLQPDQLQTKKGE